MFLTILFIVLLFSKKENKSIYQKTDDEIELFEIENPYNYSHNPSYYEDYWNKIQKKLFYFLIKSFIILGCFFLDILYIQFFYL